MSNNKKITVKQVLENRKELNLHSEHSVFHTRSRRLLDRVTFIVVFICLSASTGFSVLPTIGIALGSILFLTSNTK